MREADESQEEYSQAEFHSRQELLPIGKIVAKVIQLYAYKWFKSGKESCTFVVSYLTVVD